MHLQVVCKKKRVKNVPFEVDTEFIISMCSPPFPPIPLKCIITFKVVAGQPKGARLATYDFMNLQDTTKYVEGTHIDDDDSPALPEISSHNFIFVVSQS